MDVSPRLIRFAVLSALLALGSGPLAAQDSPGPPGTRPENQAVSEPAATEDSDAAEDMDGEEAGPAEEEEPAAAEARDGRRAEASDADLAELRERIETAFGEGDDAAVDDLFTRRSVFLPLTGETLEGARDIRRHLGDAPRPASFRMESQRIDRIGRMVIDTGRVTVETPQESGNQTIEAEYVLIARAARNGLQILHLAIFPARQAAAQ